MPANLSKPFDPSCCEGSSCNTNSAQSCGCDMGHKPPHYCERHAKLQRDLANATPHFFTTNVEVENPKLALPEDDKERKMLPVFTGLLMYFPLACAEVAKVSKIGNDQHNPGEPMHWARGKSKDQLNTAQRHLMDHGMGNIFDQGGEFHLAKAAWRILAELELTIEKLRGINV